MLQKLEIIKHKRINVRKKTLAKVKKKGRIGLEDVQVDS